MGRDMIESKQIIEEIRKIRFGIGLNAEDLTEEVRVALKDKEEILKNASRLARDMKHELWYREDR